MLPKSKYTLRDGEYQSRAQKKYLDPEWKKIKIARKQAVIETCKNKKHPERFIFFKSNLSGG